MQFERTFLAPQGFCAFAGEVGKGGGRATCASMVRPRPESRFDRQGIESIEGAP